MNPRSQRSPDKAVHVAYAFLPDEVIGNLMGFQTFAPPEPEIRAFRDVVFPRLRAAGLR
jgi:hypothetical protein